MTEVCDALLNDPNIPGRIVKVEDTAESRLGLFEIEVIKKLVEARNIYGLDIDVCRKVDIRFDLKGMCAGRAGYVTKNGVRQYYLRFNIEAIEKDFDMMVKQTIPHEIAHLVAYMVPSLKAKSHNKAWCRIDARLGGTGDRTHDLKLTRARKTKKYIYDMGEFDLHLSSIRHKRVLEGKIYAVNHEKYGRIHIKKEHFTGIIITK